MRERARLMFVALLMTPLVAPFAVHAAESVGKQVAIYTLSGTPDPTWEELLKTHQVTGANGKPALSKTMPIEGTTVHVNHQYLESGMKQVYNPEDKKNFKSLRIKTAVGDISAKEAAEKYTRWYQVDGNTQVFRLFAGDQVASLQMACRVEAFTHGYSLKDRVIVWEGTYCVPTPGTGAIAFQIGHTNVEGKGYPFISMRAGREYAFSHRYGFQKPWRGERKHTVLTNATGKNFPMRFRYDGHYYEFSTKTPDGKYEVLDGGSLPDPKGDVSFRWGAYVGGHHDPGGGVGGKEKLILVTGAHVYYEPGSITPPSWASKGSSSGTQSDSNGDLDDNEK